MEAMLAEKEVDIELFKNRDLSCTDEDPGYAAEVLPTPVAWSSWSSAGRTDAAHARFNAGEAGLPTLVYNEIAITVYYIQYDILNSSN
jgi:hypothetical protein